MKPEKHFDWDDLPVDPLLQKRLDILDAIARGDARYQKMFREYQRLEKEFFALEPQIPPEQRDIIWDYFGICSCMTHRLTELACIYMEFPPPPSQP